jgi:hypothetical protein
MTTIRFGTSDGVTGPPTINGFIDHDLMNSGEPGEPGYTNGFRRTFDGGTLSPVILQGVRVTSGDRLVIGLLARFDNSWDDNDQVIVALKPTPGSSQGQARMLVIRPVIGGIGVEAGAGSGAPNFIKTGVLLPDSRWDLWTGNASGSPLWTQVSAGKPAIQIFVRSWQPSRPLGPLDEKAWSIEISMPRLAGGNTNWLDLSDGFGAYINIIRVNPNLGAIQNFFPDTASPLAGLVGPDLAIPQYGTALIPDLQTPPSSNPGLGIFFPGGPFSIGVRPVGDTGAPGSNIRGATSPDSRENEILAIVRNTSPAPAVTGIQATFAFANWGLGTQWTTPSTLSPNPTTGSGPITTGAELPLTTVWTRAQVSAAGFGPPNDHQCMTATLSASSAVNFVQVATRRNMDFITLSEHEREAEINTEGLPDPPDGAAEHDIILRSFARQIRLSDVILASSDAQDIEGDLEGGEGVRPRRNQLGSELVAIASGALSTGAAEILNQFDLNLDALFGGWVSAEVRRAFAKAIEGHVAIVWFTEGLRRTGTTLTINGTTYENLAAELGSFGYVPHHVGVADNFSWSITGDGITRIAPGILRMRIKRGEKARIKVRIAMAPNERPGDISDVPSDPDWNQRDKPGWPTWWWVLIAAIILIVILVVTLS